MPVQRAGHPPPDFIDGRRGFGIKLIEIHLAPPCLRTVRPWRRAILWGYCWDGFG
jgi:hypothetical protein